MKVVLAGYNIEAEMASRLREEFGDSVTPEVISAAYARISRDPRSVDTLRRESREEVERARKSNRTIVFGLGHSSVAEHAVFNFDVMQISRLAVEEIESFRLASYTEKSQRYIKLGKDLVVPGEIERGGLARSFRKLAQGLHDEYEKLRVKLLDAGEEEETAKEDARYVMPLATSAQLGMTLNARELEYMISRLASHPLSELREVASRLYGRVKDIAPSLVRYPQPTEYFRIKPSIKEEIRKNAPRASKARGGDSSSVNLVEATPGGDRRIAAALIFSAGSGSYAEAAASAAALTAGERRELLTRTMRSMKLHDSVWREFESVHLLFELVVSASCYAQLKRHRMATIVPQSYLPALGISVPDSIRRAGEIGRLRKAAARAERFYRLHRKKLGDASVYALTNAHRRRVLVDLNMREMYHFSRLRSDIHAQWEIRRLSDSMCRLVSRRMPAASIMLCGKHDFEGKKGNTGI
jgi:flavin-dependent thymidylate synthase